MDLFTQVHLNAYRFWHIIEQAYEHHVYIHIKYIDCLELITGNY